MQQQFPKGRRLELRLCFVEVLLLIWWFCAIRLFEAAIGKHVCSGSAGISLLAIPVCGWLPGLLAFLLV